MEHPAPEFAQRQHFEAQPLGPWTNNREPPGDYIRAIGRDVALFTQNNRYASDGRLLNEILPPSSVVVS